MSCECLPGFVGDADVQCKPAPAQIEPGCRSDSECQFSEVCINRLCVNPCAVSSPCAPSAECVAENHRTLCRCPPGLVGDPFINCYKIPEASPECIADSECPPTAACINQRCQNPCTVSNPCGPGAECLVSHHRPLCDCPSGWAGNPQVSCYKPECKHDSDCQYDKACMNSNCVNPCLQTSCGRGAECHVQGHHPQCVCPLGTQGNPLLSCIGVICQYNEDCADHEACDRLNRKCRPVCQDDTCAPNAICTAAHHQPTCSCLPGSEGNPYIECKHPRLPAPICIQDSDCPSGYGCINQRCENPCVASDVCAKEQKCRVLDTLPLRSVVCECPPDSIATPDGHCRPIVVLQEPQCHVSGDCRDHEICLKGVCTDVCRVEPCGINAQCIGRNHQAICSCPAGYIGNPHIECATIPQITPQPECSRDDECPIGLGCINQWCVNPCAHQPCSRDSFCHVEGHKPVCRCPPGYTGNPLIECRPPADAITVGCTSNSECSPQESCINRLCVSPCNCGPNAECRVINHYPICSCLPGYSGNPQIGCVKVGCESDDQCPSHLQCYNSQCVNPCILGDACATNAECYGENHRAACRCLPGFNGNPLIHCERVECYVDTDCPSDRACHNQHCVNPCVNSPCASNAICYVRNHNVACRCPENIPLGNPLAYCERTPVTQAQPEPECRIDADCPSRLACINEKCVEPCHELGPCSHTAKCNVFDSIPVRTMTCTCADGWVPNDEGECKPVVVPSPPGCSSNSECANNETCINRLCRNPCDCGINANCFVRDHFPVCSCQEGYEGNPNIACRPVGCRSDSECEGDKACINSNCVSPCLLDNPCGYGAECYVLGHHAECRCVPGYRGDPYDRCRPIGCQTSNDCPESKACINAQCINPCTYEHPCAPNAECKVSNHLALCRCPPGELGNPYVECRPEPQPECREDSDCPSTLACFNEICRNPCTTLEPCTAPAECNVVPSLPVRTMVCVCPSGYASSGGGTCKATPPIVPIGCVSDSECPSNKACINAICTSPCDCAAFADCIVEDHKSVCSCPPGYTGNPQIECVKAECPPGKGYIRTESGECICPPGYAFNVNDECQPCFPEQGLKVDERGRCVCAVEKGFIINEKGECTCPVEFGYRRDINGNCVPVPECEVDDQCADVKYCELKTHTCQDVCITAQCGINAFCNASDHKAHCECIAGYSGDAYVECHPNVPNITADFPRPDIVVSCLADGVSVEIHITESGFNGLLYVKGHSKDENCRRSVNVPQEYATTRTELFKVQFGTCGLIHINGEAEFTLVIQKHPKLMTYKAQAYRIRCVYSPPEVNITVGFNVSMLTTAGTIANTGPPPTCVMKIVTRTGQEINSAEIGENLMLQVDVQPSSIYGGFARSCIAKTLEDNVENEYYVTDENGCATDPTIFGEWTHNADTQSLLATFNAFKFPSSDNIKFQCNIRVCFGKCQPVNCRGYDAFGRRRRRDVESVKTNSSSDLFGQLREEIIIQSNVIRTREHTAGERLVAPRDPEAQRGSDDVCISWLGLVIALILTVLLSLVAVAIAVSCWLLAYRRRPTMAGPLPHPPEFPNPLFTTPEPVAEPSPDYHHS